MLVVAESHEMAKGAPVGAGLAEEEDVVVGEGRAEG